MNLWQRFVSWFRPKSHIAPACRQMDPVFDRFMQELRTTSFMLEDITKEQRALGKGEKHDV